MRRQYIPPHRALISKARERAVAVVNTEEETMKIRLVVALVVLAIGFTVPILAQQKEPTPSEQDHQLVDAFNNKIDEAYKNNDPAAVAAFFAEDAVLVMDTGLIYGREAIQKHFADLFKQVHFSDHVGKVDQYSPRIIGNQRWDTGEWSATIEVQGQKGDPIELKGYFGCIDIREGNDWKIRMLTYNMTPPPAPPAQAK
jgi:uncharacterized protein (TIGR02246 family)